MTADARRHFAESIDRPEAEIDLAEAALWIAAEAYAELDVAAYLEQLAQLAEELRPALSGARSLKASVSQLNRALFRDKGYRGNQDDYYDPRNSFVNEVLDRRTGIPITLCLLYVEVARRLGMRAEGVSFPGHFLVKVIGDDPSNPGGSDPDRAGSEETIVVDAFAGCTLSHNDCRERLRSALGEDAPFGPSYLDAATPRQILLRMLNNLKAIYLGRKENENALACVERALLLAPDSPLEIRDRGVLYHRLECFGPALADLERFLGLAPEHESAPAVRSALETLRSQTRQIH